MVPLCWCGDRAARCPKRGTSAPMATCARAKPGSSHCMSCEPNKALRISALPVLLLSPQITGRGGKELPKLSLPFGTQLPALLRLGPRLCLVWEGAWHCVLGTGPGRGWLQVKSLDREHPPSPGG